MTRSPTLQSKHPASSSRLTRTDYIGIAFLTAFFLIFSYLRSRDRMFWGDEIMGWLVLKQPTLHSQLRLWQTGFDSSGIWFHVLGRPWIAIFGASEVSLREFSALAVAASAAVLWIAARRFYATFVVASSILFVYIAMPQLLWQLSNGRAYGIFILGAACVVYMLLRGEDPTTSKPSPLFLLATFAAYSLLTGSHTLGILYAGVFIAVQLLLDLRSHRLRIALYLSAAASFAVTYLSLSNIRGTIATGQPSYWTVPPAFRDLISLKTVFGGRHIGVVIFVLFAVALLLRIRPIAQRLPIYAILLGFAVLNVIFFICSRLTTSIYVDRYLLPFGIAAILILCELLTQIHDAKAPLPLLRTTLPAALVALALFFLLAPRYRVPFYPFPNYTPWLLAKLPPGLPIVDSDVASYREVLFYQHNNLHRPFLFPVDWQVALDAANVGGVSGFHEMDRFKAEGFYPDGIEPTAAILKQYTNFILITGRPPTAWLKRRILSAPHYTVTWLGTFDPGFSTLDIWQVHHKN
ncbi:MAG: hypothetical protein HIU91_03520 [Acidobacteria bacterium]|nr:hypothetical protein [Acidobacteriota bacterium]